MPGMPQRQRTEILAAKRTPAIQRTCGGIFHMKSASNNILCKCTPTTPSAQTSIPQVSVRVGTDHLLLLPPVIASRVAVPALDQPRWAPKVGVAFADLCSFASLDDAPQTALESPIGFCEWSPGPSLLQAQ